MIKKWTALAFGKMNGLGLQEDGWLQRDEDGLADEVQQMMSQKTRRITLLG